MPNARLVDRSNNMAKDVGEAFVHVHALRSSGLPPRAMVILGSLEGALNRVSEHNAAFGLDAREVVEEAGGADTGSTGTGASAPATGSASASDGKAAKTGA